PRQSLRARDLRSDASSSAGWGPDEQSTAERLDAIGKATETAAGLRVGAADSVVDHLDDDLTALLRNLDRGRGRLRVLADVGETLGDDVVGRHLERLLEAAIELHEQPYREWGLRHDGFECDFQAMPAQDGRVDPAGDVAELLERESDLVPRPIEADLCLGVGREPLLEQAELERKGD